MVGKITPIKIPKHTSKYICQDSVTKERHNDAENPDKHPIRAPVMSVKPATIIYPIK